MKPGCGRISPVQSTACINVEQDILLASKLGNRSELWLRLLLTDRCYMYRIIFIIIIIMTIL